MRIRMWHVFVVGLMAASTLFTGDPVAGARTSTTGQCAVPGDYDLIQTAVNDVTCQTINLGSGTFYGGVTVDRPVTITGQGLDATTVEGNATVSVFNVDSTGFLTLTNVLITNGGGSPGSGINIVGGGLFLADSALVGNTADGGGGVRDSSGTVTIRRTSIRDNVATNGGGIIALGGSLTLEDSTVSGNTATLNGGGIYNLHGSVTVSNSTLSGNEATSLGGAIYTYPGGMTVRNSTLVGNAAGNGGLYASGGGLLTNSIVAFTVGTVNCNGSVASGGFNIDSDGTCDLDEPSDMPNTDPLLGPLQDNGGPTFTHALLDGSPAIDAGSCGDIILDQRGFVRPVDDPAIANAADGCDTGSFEYQLDYDTIIFIPFAGIG